jgi:hypothetical protein
MKHQKRFFKKEYCSRRQLYRYRDFYLAYPHIVGTLSPQLQNLLPQKGSIPGNEGTLSPQSGNGPRDLLHCLSYSHFEELVPIEDPVKRSFYEVECVRGNWSVRELQRQMSSLYYERTVLSRDKTRLTGTVQGKAEPMDPAQVIRDPSGEDEKNVVLRCLGPGARLHGRVLKKENA